MKISHGSQSASVACEDFGSAEAPIDSRASSVQLGREGIVENSQNLRLELLGL